MKRLLSAALALTLLGGSAAYADPHGYGHRDNYYGERHHWRHHDDTGAAVAAGVGIFALMAILASQDRERRDAQYQGPPPPNYPDNGYQNNGGPYGPDGYGPNGYGPNGYGPNGDQPPPPPPGAYPGSR